MSGKKAVAEANATVIGELLQRIRQIWESARSQAARSVNSALVQANWLIGRQIVEAEQGGTIARGLQQPRCWKRFPSHWRGVRQRLFGERR